MNRYIAIAAALIPAQAFAAEGAFLDLDNTDFVVTLGFAIFIGILLYYKIPSTLLGMLDNRAEGIKADLAEARELREEAQTLLASYERKQKDVQAQADRIVENARAEAEANAEKAKAELATSVERRLAAAKDQIAQAEDDAKRQIRSRAVDVAIAAARQVLAEQMDASRRNTTIDESIETVRAKLH
ncbi:ATP synthase subunit b precursor [Rhodobacteraceae bacterium THAF1]|uniref:F0F1 ATP synthase subunit B family protein n=1 Tax=Palleronia sp. THAF1 TaxID=2587842 RepID=UPI000F3D792B|nr:ATP F0F1 synthase subunit B [Palleronia sp. THAF1]QFU07821.1 ATP synthase subunit b precursor [Palleronia sp. THAF1]VDC25636.1 ATP synthase subunit b precursor [Rhodobacteraceae bacterium THAF1]